MPETPGHGQPGRLARGRERAEQLAESARSELARRRSGCPTLDLVARIWGRDHDNFGSVLGSAVAFRLFLFLFALVVLAVGIGAVLLGQGWVGDGLADDLGATGTLATEVDQALREGESGGLWFVITGLVATAWAGRNLAITLTAASASAWQLSRPAGLTSVRTVGIVIGVIAVVAILASVLRLVGDAAGVIVVATSLLAIFFAYAAAWFAQTLVLPRATRDPSSLLPGAALVGATFAVLGWGSQFYLVPRLESGSAALSGVGVAAVILGWLFIVSRIMVASLAVNAVLYEQLGSVLDLLLALPGLRRLRGSRVVVWLRDDNPSGPPRTGAQVEAGARPVTRLPSSRSS
jgi:uncharacterized BrkB/YihY/UPF0761 family membrane protein